MVGEYVRVIATKEQLERNAISSPVRVRGNSPSPNIGSFTNKVGKVIGTSGGRDYGDGMYDDDLYIVSFELEDGSKKSIRIRTDLVEKVE